MMCLSKAVTVGRCLLFSITMSVMPCTHLCAATPEVNIANGPLYSGRGNVHPNMILSLSLEFPSVGIAYRGDGGTYDKSLEYVGYFNPSKCYVYPAGNRNIVDGYFSILKSANAITHECGGDSFSGNFMNWAVSSAIDMLRYALTGGDRIVDTLDTSVVQRAVLPEYFYANDRYFPRRTLTAEGNASAPIQVTPFSASTLYIISCRNRVLFSDKIVGGTCDTAAFDSSGQSLDTDKNLGEYLVRVKVCDSAEGHARVDLCQRYGTNYKPVGEIQRHSERTRFAAMGYLLDDTPSRYGGVLRASMKYVGATKFDAPGFTKTANDKPEWNADTGVLYNNPEEPSNRNSSASNSGVINYLNKFGRSGNYKSLDPIGELYYEGIRYLQGKVPTPDATTGMSETMKDGFPVVETWTDPVTASCQKNFIVSIADVNTHWDRYLPGNERRTYGNGISANDSARAVESATPKTPELDVKLWTRQVGEMEADAASATANPGPRANLADLETLDTGFVGQGTYYMAGLAYWANTHDIRLDKLTRVKTFAIDLDEGGNGQVDGNPRALQPRDSQLYLAAKYGGFDDKNKDGNPFVTFGSDGKTIVKGSNSEWDSNGNGVPSNYFLASRPQELIKSIRKIFATIASTSGTMSGVSVSSTKISGDGGFVYQPGFDASRWSGGLKKLKLSVNDVTGAIEVAPIAQWDAGEVLTGGGDKAAEPTPDAREIFTSKITDSRGVAMIPFLWDKLSTEQKSALSRSPADGSDDGLGERRLNFLRGMRTQELGRVDGIFRARDRVLGDIVNSNAAYVGAPASTISGDDYKKYYDDKKGRTRAVYVGANDGMLHAFDAENGKELFAYVPSPLVDGLNRLTSPEYVHRPYADGAITVAEAKIGKGWKTVLTAGMGGGAQGVFALDVSDPGNFVGGSGVLWEFSDVDDADIGNLIGAPLVAKFKMKITEGVPEYRYFVVVPSGLNNYRDDGVGKFDAQASTALFLLSLDKGAGEKWQLGVNYFKLVIPISDGNLQNGMSPPALVVGSDGAVRYAYAGDLQGNLWRFDFSGESPWPTALGPAPYKPLFTATDTSKNRQPITTQPKVVFAPGGGYVVLFGTGKYIEESDAAPGNFGQQSFYGIYDTTHDADKVAGRTELGARSLQKSTAAEGDALVFSGDEFTYGVTGDGKKGWYFDFIDSEKTGERSVTNPVSAYGRVFFNSLIPGSNPCEKGGGRSYAIDSVTGLPGGGDVTGFVSEVGFMSSPVLLDTAATKVGERNAIGKRIVRRTSSIANFGTDGAKAALQGSGETLLSAGRLSWREIVNWQELREAAIKKMTGGM